LREKSARHTIKSELNVVSPKPVTLIVGSAFPLERYEFPKIYPVIITEKVMIKLLKFDLRNSIETILFFL
jgi:hypothetical protein